jgi:hypothetical protein
MSMTLDERQRKMTFDSRDPRNSYDRDYVKNLEQEIELSGSNRFEGLRAGTDADKANSTAQFRIPVEDSSRK